MAFALRRLRRKTPLHDATERLPVEAPPELGAEDPGANMGSETHLLTIRGDAFAEVCWCLSDRDASSVAASAKVLKIELGDASRRLRRRSAMDLHHSTGTGGLRCNLPSSEVAQYLKAISSHLSLHSESSASIDQRSA